MQATLSKAFLGLALLAAAAGAYRWGERTVPQRAAAAPAVDERCVEGALLVHDVRWAAACMQLHERGEGDGMPDCHLPDAEAARLNALLAESEQRCRAEAK
jgi:hypothetical protein